MSAAYRELLERFGAGWERGDVDAIAAVFAPDAAFLGTPFGERAAGIDAIRAYWRTSPLNRPGARSKPARSTPPGPGSAPGSAAPSGPAAPADGANTGAPSSATPKAGK